VLRKIWLLGGLGVLALAASAETLIPPATLTFQEHPIFSPGLSLGNSGISIEGRGPSRPGQTLFAGASVFVNLGKLKDPRTSGWTLGFRAGLSENHSSVGKYLAAATTTAEVAVGRASISPEFVRNSGIRGFFEFSYRVDRKLDSSLDSPILDSKIAELAEKNIWLGFKSGASTETSRSCDPGNKFVARSFIFRSFVSFYLPIQGTRNAVFSGSLQGIYHCPFLACGLVGGYDRIWGDSGITSSDPIKHSFNFGLRLERALPDKEERNYHLAAEGVWTWVKGEHEMLASHWPVFKLQISRAF
jgi:hypothetical protein